MLRFLACSLFSALVLQSCGCEAFSCFEWEAAKTRSSTLLPMSSTSHNTAGDNNGSRRAFISQVTSAGLAFLAGWENGLLRMPSPAYAANINKVNAKLQAFGLPPVTVVGDGMTPLLEIWGKGPNRFPLLVTFNHPLTWVVTLPSTDANGEDGTIQAGEYAKGDTATLFVYLEPGKVSDIQSQPKELFEKALIKSISQKGDNMYQNFKITKLEPKTVGNQKYMLADFKYQLLTGAGFEVDRKGVASITSEGEAVEVFWAASTAVRYKRTESQLREIVQSFRCYGDGIKLDSALFA